MKVLVTVPTGKDGIDRFVTAKLFELHDDKRFDTALAFPQASPSENCRAHALKTFLDGGFDYWLSIDSDNPPAGNPLDLVDLDLDLVGCPTPVWQHGEDGKARLRWNVYRRVGDEYTCAFPGKGGDLQQVDAIGTGCFLAARRIFEPIIRWTTFQRLWDVDGTERLGSDLAFCRRVIDGGFKIHAHWGYPCNHFSVVNLAEVMEMLVEARRE